jgi:hypothetical protein
MGNSNSASPAPQPKYVLGVQGPAAKKYDPIAVDSLKASLAPAQFILGFRRASSQPFSERDEFDTAKKFSKDVLVDKIKMTLNHYGGMVKNIRESLSCIGKYCPKMVIDPITNTPRARDSLDRLAPCQEYSCMCDQLEDQLAKFTRWVETGMWPGDTAKSGADTVPIDHAGYTEILLRLQQSILSGIELVQREVSKGVRVGSSSAGSSVGSSILPNYTILIVVILLCLIVIVWLFYTDRLTTPAQYQDKK